MTGKEVKAKRRSLKLSQKELAEITGLNPADVSYHERTHRDLSIVNSYHNQILKDFFKKSMEAK